MVFEQVEHTPPSGGSLQSMLKLSDCGMNIPYIFPSDASDVVFSIWCISDGSGQITISIGNHSEDISVNTSWKRASVYISNIQQSDKINIYVGRSINVIFYEAQLEIGNKMTDWQHAPEDVDADIVNVSNRTNTVQRELLEAQADIANNNETMQNIGKWFHFTTDRGLVIQAYDLDANPPRPVGKWENVIDENSYQINYSGYGTVFEISKDTVIPMAINFKSTNNNDIVMKSDGRGGVVWMVGD